MAIKLLLMHRTQKTRLGMLHAGIIYRLDAADRIAAGIIENQTARVFGEVITAKQAEKLASEVKSLVPEGATLGDGAPADNGDGAPDEGA